MPNRFEKFSAMLKLAVSDSPEQLNSINEHFEKQRKKHKNLVAIHDKKQKEDLKQFEKNLDTEIEIADAPVITSNNLQSFFDKHFPRNEDAKKIAGAYLKEQKLFDVTVIESKLKELISERIGFSSDTISKEDEVKALDKKLNEEGKSDIEILQTLISTFGSEESLKNMVGNWLNFLELHRFTQTKPPQEQKAIEDIINNSNFTTVNCFDLALSEIEKSPDISTETKLDIQRKFKTTGINTVRAFDYTLKQEKKYKKNIEEKIRSRNSDVENLNDEIQNLNTELYKLPTDDPKRSELKARIREKGELLTTYEQELSVLNEAKPGNIQFQLRNDLMGMVNPDGSRSIKIASENFTIQLPSNNLPLMGAKNLRSINVAFPYLALRSQQISDEIFAPDLVDNSVPQKNKGIWLILSFLH